MQCPACQAEVVDGARFCKRAATNSPDGPTSDGSSPCSSPTSSGSGLGGRSRTGPEPVDSCFARLADDITSFGGRVDKVVGDAIVALFGAPIAHEDDAERAVRATLRMRKPLVVSMSTTVSASRLRIGINTGEVLVGL